MTALFHNDLSNDTGMLEQFTKGFGNFYNLQDCEHFVITIIKGQVHKCDYKQLIKPHCQLM